MFSIAAHMLVFEQLGALRSPPRMFPSQLLQVRLEVGAARPVVAPIQQPAVPQQYGQVAERLAVEGAVAGGAIPDDVEPPPVTVPVEEIYYKSSELDVQPHPLAQVDLVYTPEQIIQGMRGWVKLLLLLDEAGRVRHVEVLESDPPSVFEDGALAAFRATPFAPGQIGGEPVKSRLVVKIDFSLVGSGNQIMPRQSPAN